MLYCVILGTVKLINIALYYIGVSNCCQNSDLSKSKSKHFYYLLISNKVTQSRGFSKFKWKLSIDDIELRKALCDIFLISIGNRMNTSAFRDLWARVMF